VTKPCPGALPGGLTHRLAPGALLLGALLGLSACANRGAGSPLPDGPYAGGVSYPWSDRVAPDGSDPYAGGAAYPWIGAGAPSAGAGGLNATDMAPDPYLSDLQWTSATSAWGPIEKDRSNGDKAAGDGRTLTIGGQTFAKGLGVHAASEISYALGGNCSTFSATVGVDDEVGDRGSVVFQVWNGPTKLYDSGVRRGTDAPLAFSVPVKGVSNLRLVVTNAGDGISYDHADWGDARVACAPQVPAGDSFVSDLPWSAPSNGWGPIEQDRSNGEKALGDGRTLTIGGQTYPKGLGMNANGAVTYALGQRCRSFTASVGVDDEVGNRGSVVFQVYTDGTLVADSGVLRGADSAKPLNVDVTGVNELRLVVTNAGDGISYDHADWGDAKVSCATGSDTMPPPAPAGLTALGTGSGVTLDWPDVAAPDLAGYRLDRATAPQGPFMPVTPGLLAASSFEDAFAPEGTSSYYRVLAVDTSGNVSDAAAASAVRPAAPAANTFTYAAIASQPYGVSEAQGRVVNGKVYSFGGFDSLKGCCTPTDRAYLYEPALNVWTPLPPMPNRGATHAGMTSDGAGIYYAGGYVANSSWTGQIYGTKAVWRYDIAARTYTRLPDLPVERAAGQLEYLNGKLHYFGGTNLARTQDVGDHFVLDLAGGAQSWTTAAPLPNPRHHMGAAVLGGKIYAVGGQHGHDSNLVTQASVNAYDPATDTWTALSDLPSARGHIASSTFVLAGRIVVAGGERANGQNIATVNAYDPATDTWAALTSLPGGRVSGVAGALGNGFLFTTGNFSRSGWRASPLTP
jgi:N-acetylneuraminic acid mutarotase